MEGYLSEGTREEALNMVRAMEGYDNNNNNNVHDDDDDVQDEIARLALILGGGDEETENNAQQLRDQPRQEATPAVIVIDDDHANEDWTSDSPPKKEASPAKEEEGEEEGYVSIEDIDGDRDVLLDKLDCTPTRRIYRQLVDEYAPLYRFSPRGKKKMCVEQLHDELERRGVRFLLTDHSGDHFGRRVAITTCKRTIRARLQRSLREAVKLQCGRDWSTVSSLAPSQSSSIRTSPATFLARDDGNARSSPPIIQIDVPFPPPPMTTISNKNKKQRPSCSASLATDDLSSVHAVSMTSSSDSKLPLLLPHPTAIATPTGVWLANNVTMDVEKHTEEATVPPKLEGGIESWSSMIAIPREAEATTGAPLTLDSTTERPTNLLASKRSLEHEYDTPAQAPQRRRVSESEDIESNDTTMTMAVASSTTTPTTTPVWVHLSRHLAVLERRLETVEKENQDLRRLLSKQQSSDQTASDLWNVVAAMGATTTTIAPIRDGNDKEVTSTGITFE